MLNKIQCWTYSVYNRGHVKDEGYIILMYCGKSVFQYFRITLSNSKADIDVMLVII